MIEYLCKNIVDFWIEERWSGVYIVNDEVRLVNTDYEVKSKTKALSYSETEDCKKKHDSKRKEFSVTEVMRKMEFLFSMRLQKTYSDPNFTAIMSSMTYDVIRKMITRDLIEDCEKSDAYIKQFFLKEVDLQFNM